MNRGEHVPVDLVTFQHVQFPMCFDLGGDPGEHYNLFSTKLDMGWMFAVTFKAIAEHERSVAEYPNIPPGAEFDGYKPAYVSV